MSLFFKKFNQILTNHRQRFALSSTCNVFKKKRFFVFATTFNTETRHLNYKIRLPSIYIYIFIYLCIIYGIKNMIEKSYFFLVREKRRRPQLLCSMFGKLDIINN